MYRAKKNRPFGRLCGLGHMSRTWNGWEKMRAERVDTINKIYLIRKGVQKIDELTVPFSSSPLGTDKKDNSQRECMRSSPNVTVGQPPFPFAGGRTAVRDVRHTATRLHVSKGEICAKFLAYVYVG